MADADVAITAGAGTKIDTRTVGAGTDEHRQVVVVGDPVTAANVATVDTNGCQNVLSHQSQFWYEANVPGVAAAVYAAGDQYGTLITIANAARFTGGGGWINSILFHDDDDLHTAMEFAFFNDTLTLAADNAAFAISDADARKALYFAQMTYMNDFGAQRFGQIAGISVPYFCTGTSLYVACRIQSAITPTATGSRIRIGLTRD